MAEHPQDPSSQKLLDRVIKLEKENAALTARIAQLENRATNNDGLILRLSRQVGGVLENLGHIDMQVLELMAKVFPDYIRTQGQITKIFAPADGARQQEKDRPE